MPNVLGLRERLASDATNANEDARLHDLNQAFDKHTTSRDLLADRPAVGQRLARQMRMSGDRVPEDHTPLGTEFFEDAVDDRPGGLFPRSGAAARPPVGIAPTQKIELAGEGDARPAHALVTGRFPDRDDIGLLPFLEVLAQVGEPDRGRVLNIVGAGVPKLIEGGANRQGGELAEEGLDCGRLATIGQWS